MVIEMPHASATFSPAAKPSSPPRMLAFTIQAPAVARIRVGNNSVRCAPNAGPEGERSDHRDEDADPHQPGDRREVEDQAAANAHEGGDHLSGTPADEVGDASACQQTEHHTRSAGEGQGERGGPGRPTQFVLHSDQGEIGCRGSEGRHRHRQQCHRPEVAGQSLTEHLGERWAGLPTAVGPALLQPDGQQWEEQQGERTEAEQDAPLLVVSIAKQPKDEAESGAQCR